MIELDILEKKLKYLLKNISSFYIPGILLFMGY